MRRPILLPCVLTVVVGFCIGVYVRTEQRRVTRKYAEKSTLSIQKRNSIFIQTSLESKSCSPNEPGFFLFSVTRGEMVFISCGAIREMGLFGVVQLYHDNLLLGLLERLPLLVDLWNCSCLFINEQLSQFIQDEELLNVDLDFIIEVLVIGKVLNTTLQLSKYYNDDLVLVDVYNVDHRLLRKAENKLHVIASPVKGVVMLVKRLFRICDPNELLAYVTFYWIEKVVLTVLEAKVGVLQDAARAPLAKQLPSLTIQSFRDVASFHFVMDISNTVMGLISREKSRSLGELTSAYRHQLVLDTILRLSLEDFDPVIPNFHSKLLQFMYTCSGLSFVTVDNFVEQIRTTLVAWKVVLRFPVESISGYVGSSLSYGVQRALRGVCALRSDLLHSTLQVQPSDTEGVCWTAAPIGHVGLVVLLCVTPVRDSSPSFLTKCFLLVRFPLFCPRLMHECYEAGAAALQCGQFSSEEARFMEVLLDDMVQTNEISGVESVAGSRHWKRIPVEQQRKWSGYQFVPSPPPPLLVPLTREDVLCSLQASVEAFSLEFTSLLPSLCVYSSRQIAKSRGAFSDLQNQNIVMRLNQLGVLQSPAVEVTSIFRVSTPFSVTYDAALPSVKTDTLWSDFGMAVLERFSVPVVERGTTVQPPLGPWSITFEHVWFRYPRSSRWALQDVSFKIKAGECCGIVGFNGSGKSTLFHLLTRTYSPTSGTILLNGVCITQFCRRELCRRIGYAWQENGESPFLPEYSLEANIGLSDITASRESIVHSLQSVSAGEVADLTHLSHRFYPDDYSTGEVQRIHLSRLFVKHPDSTSLYLVDEGTSALDASTQENILSHLLGRGSTSMLIVHSLHVLKRSNCILVFDSGQLVEQGTWDMLSSCKSGIFFNLLQGTR